MSVEGFFGANEQNLVDMIQMWGLAKTTGILNITSGKETGEVHFEGGRVVWAKAGPYLSNEDAIYHILALEEGKFRFVNTSEIPKSRHRFRQLISIAAVWPPVLHQSCQNYDIIFLTDSTSRFISTVSG